MDERTEIRIDELVFRSLEGLISEQECRELEVMIEAGSLAREYYCSCVDLNLGMLKIKDAAWRPLQMTMVLEEMAEYEKTAPETEIPKEKPLRERELIQKVVYRSRGKRKISKFSIFTLAMSTAAVLSIVAMILFSPIHPVVATLTDSINAEWMDTGDNPVIDDVLRQGELTLVRGLAEITFDNGAIVIVEAPAVFDLESSQSMFLTSGRMSAVVSEYAIGFTVNTFSGSIVDLGTEFGVSVEGDGTCELHMFEGKANLIAGQTGEKRTSQIVSANEARSIDPMIGSIKEVELVNRDFVRQINSEKGFIWRGENFNLADVVGGGDGFGTGVLNVGIDLRTGKQITVDDSCVAEQGDGLYKPAQNPYVDGVFVPDGRGRSVQISSTGLCFAECPETLGCFYGSVFNGGWHIHSPGEPPHLLKLGGRTFEKSGEALYMHSNMGITFDLKAIRQCLPGGRHIQKFAAFAGVSETVLEIWSKSSRVDFRVLVDGRVKVERVNVKPEDGPFDIDVALTGTDRFLTLITTDSDKNTNRDWALFAEPTLVLEQKE